MTLFWQCVQNGLVQVFKDPDTFMESKYFDEENIYYDITKRNGIINNTARKTDLFDW
jgi:hypothetical protein